MLFWQKFCQSKAFTKKKWPGQLPKIFRISIHQIHCNFKQKFKLTLVVLMMRLGSSSGMTWSFPWRKMPRASPLRPDPSTPRWCRKGRPFRGGSARRLSKRGGVSGSPQGPSSAPTKGLRSQPRRAVCTPSCVKSGMTDDSNLFGWSTFYK